VRISTIGRLSLEEPINNLGIAFDGMPQFVKIDGKCGVFPVTAYNRDWLGLNHADTDYSLVRLMRYVVSDDPKVEWTEQGSIADYTAS
jgi:hypothetical protein